MSAESGVAADNRKRREHVGMPPNAMELARVEVTAIVRSLQRCTPFIRNTKLEEKHNAN